MCEKLETIRSQIADGETKDGLSWLEVKNQMLLGYLVDTNHVVYNKLKGETQNIDELSDAAKLST